MDNPAVPVQMTDQANKKGCKHYSRNCKLISPCCKKTYVCRLCHDAEEDHVLNRYLIKEIQCLLCCSKQPVSNLCSNCGTKFAEYYCQICRLYDCKKDQFHCKGCGLCRVGGKENFFHCPQCNACLPNEIKEMHKCIAQASMRDCPICLEDLHSARTTSHIPPCGHFIHRPCYEKLLVAGHFACPICGKSMIEMKDCWKTLQNDIDETEVESGMEDAYCNIHCNDCNKSCISQYHQFGMKCESCGSFNTSKGEGPMLRMVSRGEAARNSRQGEEP